MCTLLGMLCKLPFPECFPGAIPYSCLNELKTTFECVNWITPFPAIQFTLRNVGLPVENADSYTCNICIYTCFENLPLGRQSQSKLFLFLKAKKLPNLQMKGTLQLKVRKSSCNLALTSALDLNFKF